MIGYLLRKSKIILLYLLCIQLLFSKLNNFLKAVCPNECVFVHETQMSPEIFMIIFKMLQGMLRVFCQPCEGVGKANETSHHWVCAQQVLQQHKQDVQWKHRMNTKSAHVGRNVCQGRKVVHP